MIIFKRHKAHVSPKDPIKDSQRGSTLDKDDSNWDDRKQETENWVNDPSNRGCRGWVNRMFILPQKMEEPAVKSKLLYYCPNRHSKCMILHEKAYKHLLERCRGSSMARWDLGSCTCGLPASMFEKCIPSESYEKKWRQFCREN